MTVKKARLIIIILAALASVLFFLCVWLLIDRCSGNGNISENTGGFGNGLFSWHDEAFNEDERKVLFTLMKDRGLTELYQSVSKSIPASKIKDLAKSCEENGVRLFLLVGEPEWALDENGSKLKEQIQRAALIGCAGVVVDIEPGSTERWKKDRNSVMSTMTKAILNAKASAEENGLEIIVCLAYYYDDYGFEKEIETIVEYGCDTLAIMNYNRRDEISQIKNEAALCKQYNKRLISIHELQEVGKHELKEINTYRNVGLSALQDSQVKIMAAFDDQKISFALHEYGALKEMMELK